MRNSTQQGAWRSPQNPFNAAESWADSHLHWLVLLTSLAGLYLRVARAEGRYFNGDETQLLFPALQSGIVNVYQAGLAFPHGELANFLWHFLAFFGNSELYFRIPSALAGALIAFVSYHWVAAMFDRGAGLIAACILSFAPNLVQLSAEVRPYMFHGVCLVFSLYCLERAFRERSLKWMRWFGAGLLFALLMMYMSVWYTIAIGVYAFCYFLNRELPKRLMVEWAVIQVAAAGICLAAYLTHLYRIHGNQAELFAQDVWLRGSYYHPEDQSVSAFLLNSSVALSAYLYANARLGTLMAGIFLVGVGLILRGNAGPRRIAAFALTAPFVVTAMAALMRLYPYGGTRHDAFLCVFLAAGTGVTLSFLARRRVLILLLAAALLVPAWRAKAEPHYLSDDPQFQQLSQMNAAVAYLDGVTPRALVVVADQHSAIMVKHYVCRDRIMESVSIGAGLVSHRCGGYRLLEVSEWSVSIPALASALLRAREVSADLFPEPAWYFHMAAQPLNDAAQNTEPGARFGKIYVGRIL